MLLACLGGLVFSMSVIASSSSKRNGAETSRVQEHSFASQKLSARDQVNTLSGESEDNENIVHRSIRMVRKFPEESKERSVGHRQALVPTSRTTCICPEVLTKSTLVAIIGSLAFLGFFSTLVLLLVAIIILRLVDRQWKKEKKEKKEADLPKRSLPLVPRRPTETLYMGPKASSGYKMMRPVSEAAGGTYVDPKDLHPGPRIHEVGKYGSPKGAGAEARSPSEKAYTSMQPAPHFSTSSPERTYISVLPEQPFSTSTPENAYTSMQSAPLFSTSTPENAYTSMQSAPLFSTPSPEHVYASIHRPQAEHENANVAEPQSESMADEPLATEEQTKGPEEHFYEEIN